MNNKIISLLGFAAKAGALSYGFKSTVTSLKQGKTHLVVIAEDISVKSHKEIVFFAQKGNVKIITLEGIDIKTVSDAVGRKCGIVSINDIDFANGCKQALIKGGFAND